MKLVAALDFMAEATWCAAFAAAGRMAGARPPRWVPSGGQRILVIAPHPDDETVGCAGTILLHARSGDAICIAFITDGSKSRAGGLTSEEMGRRRRQEAQAAASALRASRFEWFGFAEGGWTFEQLRIPLLNLLQEISPQVIYAPSCADFHPEHHRVAHGLARILSGEGKKHANAKLRVYQLQVPLTTVLTNLVVDCSNVSEGVAAASAVYVTQSANIGRAGRTRRYAALFYGLKTLGEEFWQMPAADYCRLHLSPPESWHTDLFRGVRYRSFSDPLTYLSGLNERKRLIRALGTASVPEGER